MTESFEADPRLSELPLRRFRITIDTYANDYDVEDVGSLTSALALEALCVQGQEFGTATPGLDKTLSRMFIDTPMTSSLRELGLQGLGLVEVPASLRGLSLTKLGLDGNYNLDSLPEWLGDMPPIALSLVTTEISSHSRSKYWSGAIFYEI